MKQPSADTTAQPIRWRRVLGLVSALTGFAALAGAVQLIAGVLTPPVDDLSPLGLRSWALPGLWLAASVALPCAVVTVLAWRRSRRVGAAAVVAGVLLAVELLVQMPFVGLDPLQAVMGLVAALQIGLGSQSRRRRGLVAKTPALSSREGDTF